MRPLLWVLKCKKACFYAGTACRGVGAIIISHWTEKAQVLRASQGVAMGFGGKFARSSARGKSGQNLEFRSSNSRLLGVTAPRETIGRTNRTGPEDRLDRLSHR
jgi:hypothetical protein